MCIHPLPVLYTRFIDDAQPVFDHLFFNPLAAAEESYPFRGSEIEEFVWLPPRLCLPLGPRIRH